MSIHRNIYRERFIEAIGGVEELKNYVYAGGNDERHLNYRLLVSEDFSVKKYTKLPLKIPSSKRFSHIPVELREMANDEEFTKKVLEDSDYTDVLRLALLIVMLKNLSWIILEYADYIYYRSIDCGHIK